MFSKAFSNIFLSVREKNVNKGHIVVVLKAQKKTRSVLGCTAMKKSTYSLDEEKNFKP